MGTLRTAVNKQSQPVAECYCNTVTLASSHPYNQSFLGCGSRKQVNLASQFQFSLFGTIILHLTARRYSNLDPISEETLRLGLSGVTQAVKRTIAEELPSHFGVMFDGVTHASEHYVAWFGCIERNDELVTVLIGMAPLLNEPNDDLSARTLLDSWLRCYLETTGYRSSSAVFSSGTTARSTACLPR
ncbi:hypothetical protein PC110_g20049 [Phytophthora cactorum]|uniref:Uncharacterized protein n=1 Tax=Phytophthora cactorum TaxID=29920 RepID=A0A329RFH4_9STRA|nr:hypothetical protein PC110_g20049 [Phytophthora cactorum]